MRIPLLAFPYKVIPAGQAAERGWKGWRASIHGVQLLERCGCDSIQDCEVYRISGVDEWIEEDTGERMVYDPRTECACRLRRPHTHSFVGQLTDVPLGPK